MTADAITLRTGGREDFEPLGALMFAAVRTGPSPYSEAQRAAWVSEPRKGAEWNARLRPQHAVLAEDASGRLLGFMTLAGGGYIDFAYIVPDARGSGVFRRLFDSVAAEARLQGVSRLWVHASLMAEPAFAAMGFALVRREQVTIGAETLDRCEMAMGLE